MSQKMVESDLSRIAMLPDFENRAYEITEAWRAAGVGADAIDPILRFMELHPDIEYGSPGPLTHFVESIRGADYAERLAASMERTPTMITLWMLNRLINGTDTPQKRRPLIACLRRSRVKIQDNEDLSGTADSFLDHVKDSYPGE